MIISRVSIISFLSLSTHYNNNIIIDNLTYNSYERYWYIFFYLFFCVYSNTCICTWSYTHTCTLGTKTGMFYFAIYFFQVFLLLKVFYYSYCYFIYFYLLVLLPGMWNLSFPTGDQTCTLCIESTTLTSRPAGKFHAVSFLYMGQFCISVYINHILYYNIIFISPTFCW